MEPTYTKPPPAQISTNGAPLGPCLGLKKVDTFRKGKTCQKWTKTILLKRATGSYVQNGGNEPCPMTDLKL